MALPGTKDLDVYRGDYFVRRFRLRNADGTYLVFGAGDSVAAQIKARLSDDAPVASFDASFGELDGEIVLELSSIVTASLPSEAHYDVEVIDSLDRPRTFLAGAITVHDDATRV